MITFNDFRKKLILEADAPAGAPPAPPAGGAAPPPGGDAGGMDMGGLGGGLGGGATGTEANTKINLKNVYDALESYLSKFEKPKD